MPTSLLTDDCQCENPIPNQVTEEDFWAQAGLLSLCLASDFDSWPWKCCYLYHNLESLHRSQNARTAHLCISWKQCKITYLWESSVRNPSLSKNRELRNSEYLLYHEPISWLSCCYYQLLDVWQTLLFVLLLQGTNFTTFPSWQCLTISIRNTSVTVS